MLGSSYIGVMVIGFLHGLEPGHGWPVAFLYSVRTSKPLFNGFISSGIISLAHFVSAIAVVLAYVLLSSLFNVSTPFMKYVAAALLIILAYRLFTQRVEDEYETQHGHIHENQHRIEHEHEHEHPGQDRHTHWHKHMKRIVLGLWGLASFAFILGFAHEEEFALLALAAAGINPLILMISYAVSVALALIGITLVSVKAYKALEPNVRNYGKYVPKISACVLLTMATTLILVP